MKKLINISLFACGIALLTACGGDGDGLSPNTKTAQLTFAVSDSANDLQKVIIAFKNVAIKRIDEDDDNEEGDEQVIAVEDENGESTEYRQIDLLQFQGNNAAELFSDVALEPGDYQMCIFITDGTGSEEADDSYVVEENGVVMGLRTPSNGGCAGFIPDDRDSTGRLKTTTFTINEGKNYLVAEFDLNKVLKEPVGNKDYWTLKPNGYELIHADNAGSIEGRVSAEVVTSCGDERMSVYLYPATPAEGTPVELMGDFRAEIIDQYTYLGEEMKAPVASAIVSELTEGIDILYQYEFGFVLAGNYSIGYICSADDSEEAEPEVADPNVTEPPAPSLIYQAAPAVNVEVIAGEVVIAAPISEL